MATAEERLRVLTLIEKGKVTAEEGARLLEALKDEDEEVGAKSRSSPGAWVPKRLLVRVTDLTTGQQKVNINLPWSLVSVGLSMGARFTPPDVAVDLEGIMEAVEAGAGGKVLDVADEEENERVEIFVE